MSDRTKNLSIRKIRISSKKRQPSNKSHTQKRPYITVPNTLKLHQHSDPASYVESLIAEPEKFLSTAREFTSTLFSQLFLHIGAQQTPCNVYHVPKMEPFVIKDRPLAVTVTSNMPKDHLLPTSTLLLPPEN